MLEINNIYCCDALEGLNRLDSNSVDLILTDPPFGVDYGSKSKFLEKIGKSGKKQIQRDETYQEFNLNYNLLANEFYRVLKNNTHCYIFCSNKQIAEWIISMKNAGFKNYQILVWYKHHRSYDLTRGHYFPENKEQILFFHKGFKKLNTDKVDGNKFASVLSFKRQNKNIYHPTERCFDLLNFLIKLSSNENDLILDCFSGGGNHLIACKNLKRNFLGFEISKDYFNVINKRLNSNLANFNINFKDNYQIKEIKVNELE